MKTHTPANKTAWKPDKQIIHMFINVSSSYSQSVFTQRAVIVIVVLGSNLLWTTERIYSRIKLKKKGPCVIEKRWTDIMLTDVGKTRASGVKIQWEKTLNRFAYHTGFWVWPLHKYHRVIRSPFITAVLCPFWQRCSEKMPVKLRVQIKAQITESISVPWRDEVLYNVNRSAFSLM